MNRDIIVAPWAKALRNGKENAKNYPFSLELVSLLKENNFNVIQVGGIGERLIGANEVKLGLSLSELEVLIRKSYTVVTVDSFIQHYCWYLDKQAIVLWGKSDPLIFGHESNINLLKDRKNLREDSFRWWEDVSYDENVFVSPQYVIENINKLASSSH